MSTLRGHAFDSFIIDEAQWLKVQQALMTGDFTGDGHENQTDCPVHGVQSYCHHEAYPCAKCHELAGYPECGCRQCVKNRVTHMANELALIPRAVWVSDVGGGPKYWTIEGVTEDTVNFMGPASKQYRNAWHCMGKYLSREEVMRTMCPLREGEDPWTGLP